MRHSTIDLTMNVDTDPKLLDVYGILDAREDGTVERSDDGYRRKSFASQKKTAVV